MCKIRVIMLGIGLLVALPLILASIVITPCLVLIRIESTIVLPPLLLIPKRLVRLLDFNKLLMT
jgi:hypothetical protein